MCHKIELWGDDSAQKLACWSLLRVGTRYVAINSCIRSLNKYKRIKCIDTQLCRSTISQVAAGPLAHTEMPTHSYTRWYRSFSFVGAGPLKHIEVLAHSHACWCRPNYTRVDAGSHTYTFVSARSHAHFGTGPFSHTLLPAHSHPRCFRSAQNTQIISWAFPADLTPSRRPTCFALSQILEMFFILCFIIYC